MATIPIISRIACVTAIAFVGSSKAGNEDDFLPPRHVPARHSSTWSNSPFSRTVLPAREPNLEIGPHVSDGWTLTAIDSFGGDYTVGLRTKKNAFITLKLNEPTPDGVWVSKIEHNGSLANAVVYVTDGTRTEPITYDSKHAARPKGNTAPKAKSKPAATAIPSRPRSSPPAKAAAAHRRSPLAPPR